MAERNKAGVVVAVFALCLIFGLLVGSCGRGNDPAVAVRSAPLATNEGIRERIGLNSRVDSWFYNGADLLFFSDDHSTQKLYLYGDSGNIDSEGTLDVAGAVTLGGALTLNDSAELTGTLTANAAVITTSVSAADLAASDDLVVGDDATITGTLTLGDLSIGGGYGDTGCTVSDAGVLQCNGAITTGGALSADSATVTGTLKYGDLYPLGFAFDGYQMVLGSSTVTTTTVITHGLTTPLYAFCTMSGSLTDNEEQICSVGIVTDTVTLYVWKEDGTAGDSGVDVFWQVFGTP